MQFPNSGSSSDDDGDGESSSVSSPNAIRILTDRILDRALRRPEARRLRGHVALIVVLRAPKPDYVKALANSMSRRSTEALVVANAERKRRAPGTHDEDILRASAAGQHVVGISHDPEALLPSMLFRAADVNLAIDAADVNDVRAAIRAVTGQMARGLLPSDVAGRDLSELAVAIRMGASARQCVLRLKRAAPTTGVGPDGPKVEDLPLCGDAAAWAQEAIGELTSARIGGVGDVEGALLFGPPGTGKTILAGAVARSAGVPLITTSVAEWFLRSDGHLDGVLKAAETFFESVLDAAPAVGLLDELEALPDRSSLDARHREWWNSVITGVLLMVTKVRRAGRGVLLVGATNYAGRVDAALTRPGRLGRHVFVRPPSDPDEMRRLISFFARGDLSSTEVERVLALAGVSTPAATEAWFEGARRKAAASNRPLVLDDVAEEIAPPSSLPAIELRHLAFHELGHALAALEVGLSVEQVSIVQRGPFGGVTRTRGNASVLRLSDLEDRVVMMLAGRAADELLGAGADAGSMNDIEQSTEMLLTARVSYGLNDSLLFRAGPNGVREILALDPALRRDVEADLKRLMTRARGVVERHRDAIGRMADLLVERRVLSSDEFLSAVDRLGTTVEKVDRPTAAQGQVAEPLLGPAADRSGVTSFDMSDEHVEIRPAKAIGQELPD